MEFEKKHIEVSLKKLFETASDIFIDTLSKECEVKISVDEFQGEIPGRLYENGVQFNMIDYCDVYPFKYVFSYRKIR